MVLVKFIRKQLLYSVHLCSQIVRSWHFAFGVYLHFIFIVKENINQDLFDDNKSDMIYETTLKTAWRHNQVNFYS